MAPRKLVTSDVTGVGKWLTPGHAILVRDRSEMVLQLSQQQIASRPCVPHVSVHGSVHVRRSVLYLAEKRLMSIGRSAHW